MSNLPSQYAKALFETVRDEKCIDEVFDEFSAFIQSIDSEINLFLNHPKISKEDKKDALEKVLNNELFRNFIFITIDNSRQQYLSDIFNEFKKITKVNEKIMDVKIYSNKKLSDTDIKKLIGSLERKYEAKVVVDNLIDETIIGGIKLVYQGKVLNDTVNDYFDNLKSTLVQ